MTLEIRFDTWDLFIRTTYLEHHLPTGRREIATIQIYTADKLDLSGLKNDHTLGCLVYVLDPTLQDRKITKWQSKTRQG